MGAIPIASIVMVELPTVKFLLISDLFERYTIVVNTSTKDTSVYCEECDVWVERYDGDQLSRNTPDDFYEMIVADHNHQVRGEPVEIAADTESFL